jgi:acetyl-CoA carboxylase carboxyl transferase subunit beta
MVDRVVHRRDMKDDVARLCRLLTRAPALGAETESAEPAPEPAMLAPAP